MTEYIKREDAIQKFAGVTLIECDKTTAESPYSLSAAEKFFADIPSADVVEVVRCKDCKYHAEFSSKCNKLHLTPMRPNDFCSYGERRE